MNKKYNFITTSAFPLLIKSSSVGLVGGLILYYATYYITGLDGDPYTFSELIYGCIIFGAFASLIMSFQTYRFLISSRNSTNDNDNPQ